MNKPSQILVGLSVLLFLLSRGHPVSAQTVSPMVVASTGADTQFGNTQVSYTVGEPMIQTLTIGNTNLLSQGFQQPDYDIAVSVVNGIVPDYIRVFPNPTPHSVTVQVGSEQYVATVYDVNGQIVVQAQKISGSTQIDLSHLAAGKYILRLQGQISYTFSVIKLH